MAKGSDLNDAAREEEARIEVLGGLVRDYVLKLGDERKARLEGRIAEADLYVRQVTWFEAAMDVISGDAIAFLRDFRHNGYDLIGIAATPITILLDEARREYWAQAGEPRRPEHPPAHLIETGADGLVTEPLECARSGQPLSLDEQWAAFKERHREDAAAQLRWEAEAAAEAAAWRARVESEGDPSRSGGEEHSPSG
jgi:hypothetical protein